MIRAFALCFVVSLAQPVFAQSEAELAAAVTERAARAYGEGDFERAAVLLEESIALHETPALHYNLARTMSELSRWEEARTHFLRFLALSPDAPQRAAVERRLEELDRRIAREGNRPSVEGNVAEDDPPTAVTPAPRSHSPAPWILMGGGGLVAAAAIPLGLASSRAEDRAASAESHREGSDELDKGRRLARAANGMLIAGGLVVAGAIVWAIVQRSGSDDEGVSFDGTSLRVRF